MLATTSDRLSNILAAYIGGRLELDTCAAELTHVYVERGWHFYLVEAECAPEHRDRMRAWRSGCVRRRAPYTRRTPWLSRSRPRRSPPEA